jgi:flavin reductase ActVB
VRAPSVPPRTDAPGLEAARFKEAVARFASGVTIVATRDADGAPHGFTASSFCSVSLDPPLVCVCVAHTARCHTVFAARDDFSVNVLRPTHADLATWFARSGDDKFTRGDFRFTGRHTVVLDDALAVLRCVVHSRFEAGDHTILVGEVRQAEVSSGDPLVYFDRGFHRLEERDR